jgi:hypothetical protein
MEARMNLEDEELKGEGRSAELRTSRSPSRIVVKSDSIAHVHVGSFKEGKRILRQSTFNDHLISCSKPKSRKGNPPDLEFLGYKFAVYLHLTSFIRLLWIRSFI